MNILPRAPMPRSPRAVLVLALLVGAALTITVIAHVHAGEPSGPFLVGSETAGRRLAAEPSIAIQPGPGYDGQFHLALALDPLLNGDVARAFDDPRYRGRRALWSWLAAAVGLGEAGRTVAALLLLQVAFVGLGSWALARWAVERGHAAAWGLSFTAALGTVICLSRMLGDAIVAALLLAAALAAARPGGAARLGSAALFGLALLQKETALVALPLVAVPSLAGWRSLPGRARLRRALAIVLALAPAGIWWAWVATRTPATDGRAAEINLDLPFVGWARALAGAMTSPESLVHAAKDAALLALHLALVLTALAVGLRELPRLRSGFSAASIAGDHGAHGLPLALLGLALLATLLGASVLVEPWAYGRALLPLAALLTAWGLTPDAAEATPRLARTGRQLAVALVAAGLLFAATNLVLGHP